MLSAPPAMTTRSMPARMVAAAVWIGAIPDAVPVVGEPGHVGQAEVDRGVAGDAPAALERLAHDDVVDVLGGHARALQRLADRGLRQLEDVDVDERPLPRRSDGRPGGGDDDG